jgi:hypothetical protein
MNFLHQNLLAAGDDESVGKIAVAVIAVIIWAIGALAKKASQSSTKQKDRLREVRESIERAHGQNQPVTLDPEIARRLPPMIPQKPPVARTSIPRPQISAGRPATNYNQMTTQRRSAPPPIAGQRIPTPPWQNPRKAKPGQVKRRTPQGASQPPVIAPRPPVAAAAADAILLPDTPRVAAQTSNPVVRPAITASTIKRWATPNTLRQQFILTEIFQPPLAMRPERFS